MASPWQRDRIIWPLTAQQVESIDAAFEDIYAFMRQSPLGTSDDAFDFSELADTGILYLDTADALQSLSTVGSVYVNASGEPRSLSAALGNVLISGGVGAVPSFGKVDLTLHVTGILPVANGGSGTSTVFTQGSVIFAGASGIYTQDNAGLFFDATNDRLGIGVASPTDALDIRGTSPIAGIRFSSSTGFGSFRIYEGNTLVGAINVIGSGFATVARRADLELINLTGGDVSIWPGTGSATAAIFSSSARWQVGSATVAGSGTDYIVFPDGTAPATLASDTAAIYANDVSGTVKMFAITEAGVTGELAMNAAALTNTRVLFAGSTGLITTDSAFVYDATNDFLGVGITPAGTLDVTSTQSIDAAFAFRAQATHNTATAGTVYGAQFIVNTTHSSGVMNNSTAFFIQALYRGTSTATQTALVGVQARTGIAGTTPNGTVSRARAFHIDQMVNFASGSPTVTITQAQGLGITDVGTAHGAAMSITNISGIAIAGTQTSATNSTTINIGSGATIPDAPSGTWGIYNGSTRNSYFAGTLQFGHTTTWGSGTNFVSFANGTVPGTPPADSNAIYAADIAAGKSNLFVMNEAGVINQLSGLDIRKTADESVANNTPQNDDHLLTDLPASAGYSFEFYGFFTGAGTAGILLQLDGTVGISLLKANIEIFSNTGALLAFGRKTAFNSSTGVDHTGDGYFKITGSIETTTAGTFRLEWAQNTTDAGNSTTVQENSFLTLRRLNG